MEILNIRLGFSSNSSSYHSTLLPEGIAIEEFLPSFLARNNEGKLVVSDNEIGFGWEPFVLKEKDTIDLYLFAQVFSALKGQEDYVKESLLKMLFPDTYDERFFNQYSYGVDHQSAWSLPKDFMSKNNVPSVDFIRDLQEYLHTKDVVVVGGHDNGYDEDELKEPVMIESEKIRDHSKEAIVELIKDKDKNFYVYKDGQVWILFNPKTGVKFRMSFKDGADYEKASKPELVDVIISNKCSQGCEFCYRDCTPTGKDATIKQVKTVLSTLLDMGVPEIVIGGGDILRYSYLEELCDYIMSCRQYYNSVFTTTLNVSKEDLDGAIKNRLSLILNTFDAVALSYNGQYEFNDIVSFCKVNGKATLSVQLVPELYSMKYETRNLKEMQKMFHTPLVLLGFKETGRGRKLPKWLQETVKTNKERLMEDIKDLLENRWGVIGVDTQFLANFPEMKSLSDKRTFTLHEGKFSCCIDVTNNTILQSSYSEKSYPLKTGSGFLDTDSLLETFQSF